MSLWSVLCFNQETDRKYTSAMCQFKQWSNESKGREREPMKTCMMRWHMNKSMGAIRRPCTGEEVRHAIACGRSEGCLMWLGYTSRLLGWAGNWRGEDKRWGSQNVWSQSRISPLPLFFETGCHYVNERSQSDPPPSSASQVLELGVCIPTSGQVDPETRCDMIMAKTPL